LRGFAKLSAGVVVILSLLVLIIYVTPVLAGNFAGSSSPTSVESATNNTLLDFSINNNDTYYNITNLTIQLTNFTFITDSNSTSTSASNFFENTTTNLTWGNLSGWIVGNNTGTPNTEQFVFNVSSTSGIHVENVLVFTVHTDGTSNLSTVLITLSDSMKPYFVDFVSPSPADNDFDTATSAINVTYTETNFANCTMQIYNATTGAGQNFTNTTTVGNTCLFNDFGTQSDGEVNVTVFVWDTTANINNTANKNWTIDGTDPDAIDFSTPASGSFQDASTTITAVFTETNPTNCIFMVSNLTDVDVNYTNSSVGSSDCTFDFTFATGNVNATLFVLDAAGMSNATQSFFNFTVDATSPAAIDFVSPTPTALTFDTDTTPIINVTFTETYFTNCTMQWYNATYPAGQNLTTTTSTDGTCAFTQPTQTDGEVNVTVFVFDITSNVNSTENRNWTIDSAGPSAIAFTSPTNNAFQNSAAVTMYGVFTETNPTNCIFMVSNLTDVDVNYTNSSVGSADCTFAFTFADGNVNATLFALDAAGVSNATQSFFNFTVDATSPAAIDFVSPTPTASSFSTDTTPEINITYTETNFVNCIMQFYNATTGAGQNFTNTTTVGNTCFFNAFGTQSSGEVNVTVFVTDSAGTVNSTENRNWTIDATVPAAIDFASPTPPASSFVSDATSDVYVTYTETNFANCTMTWYNTTYPGGQNFTNSTPVGTSCSFILTTQSAGQVNTTVFVTDVSGNSNKTENRNWTIDATEPSAVDFISPTPSASSFDTDTTPIINITYTETYFANCTMQWYNATYPAGQNLTTTTTTDNKCSFTLPTQSVGQVNVTVFVYDIASNVNNTENRNWTIDATVPAAIDFASPTPPASSFSTDTTPTVNVTYTETNIVSCTFQWYNTTTGAGQNLTNSTPSEGACSITLATHANGQVNTTVFVTDASGNINNTANRNWTIDGTAPLYNEFISPTPSASSFSTDTTPTINVTLSETYFANCTMQWYNATYPAGQNLTTTTTTDNKCSVTLPTQSVGQVNVTVFVYDVASNVNNTENRNWTIDATVPAAIDFIDPTPANNNITSADNFIEINATFTEAYVTACYVEIYNASAANYTGTIDGTYCFFNSSHAGNYGHWNFTVYITDAAGNVNVSARRTVTVDMSAPGLTSWAYSVVSKNLTLVFNETMDGTLIDLAKINITSQDGSVNVQLVGAGENAGLVNATTYSDNLSSIVITLKYAQYSIIEGIGNTPLQIDMGAGALKDVAGFNVLAKSNLDISTYSQYTIMIPVTGYWGTSIWNAFQLPLTILQTASSLSGNYTVQKVLTSVSGNYERIYYYNGSDWTMYDPNIPTSDFTEFTADDSTHTYWINISATDRLEIE